jgi:hypothetical protein
LGELRISLLAVDARGTELARPSRHSLEADVHLDERSMNSVVSKVTRAREGVTVGGVQGSAWDGKPVTASQDARRILDAMSSLQRRI